MEQVSTKEFDEGLRLNVDLGYPVGNNGKLTDEYTCKTEDGKSKMS